jgi:Alpha/beta hydrolase of unknown function (DUF900)
MPHWFLSTRTDSHGGPVGPVKVIDSDRLGSPYDLGPELFTAIQGREIFFAAHGFNVNQDNGIHHLNYWFDNMKLGNALPIGILWPGDCFVPIFVDYVVEGHEAIASGKLLANFLNTNFTAAAGLCFVSHSLGARVVLQTVDGLASSFDHRIRRCILMAGAVDNSCLTDEYSKAANRIEQISLLASRRDDVLKLAFPLGNPIQGIIDRWHPYYHAALGREGPVATKAPAPHLRANWQIPDHLNYGHLDYVPGDAIKFFYTLPMDIPPDLGPCPPAGTPQNVDPWKPAFSAAFASSRYL